LENLFFFGGGGDLEMLYACTLGLKKTKKKGKETLYAEDPFHGLDYPIDAGSFWLSFGFLRI
jgi:hypothetical protein